MPQLLCGRQPSAQQQGLCGPQGHSAPPAQGLGSPTHLEEFVAHSDSSPGRRAFLGHPRDEYALEDEQEPQGSAQPGRASKAQQPPGPARAGGAAGLWRSGWDRTAAAPRATKPEGGQPPKTTSTQTRAAVPGLHIGPPFAAPRNEAPPRIQTQPHVSGRRLGSADPVAEKQQVP